MRKGFVLAAAILTMAVSVQPGMCSENCNLPPGQSLEAARASVAGVVVDAGGDEAATDQSVTFPSTGDTRFTASGGNWFWTQGDYVEGQRTFTVAPVGLLMTLVLGENVLSCDNQDHALTVDGEPVGTFVVRPGATGVVKFFPVAAIPAGAHRIRITTTRTVTGACGSAGFADDVSTILVSATSFVDSVGLRDINRNGKPEVAMLFQVNGSAAVVRIRDAATKAVLRNITFLSSACSAKSLAVLPDMNRNGSEELVVLGLDQQFNPYEEIRDSRTGRLIKKMAF